MLDIPKPRLTVIVVFHIPRRAVFNLRKRDIAAKLSERKNGSNSIVFVDFVEIEGFVWRKAGNEFWVSVNYHIRRCILRPFLGVLAGGDVGRPLIRREAGDVKIRPHGHGVNVGRTGDAADDREGVELVPGVVDHAEGDLHLAVDAQRLLCQLEGDDVGAAAGHHDGLSGAAGKLDGVIPAGVVGTLAVILHGIDRAAGRGVRHAAVVQRDADEPALRVGLHDVDHLRQARVRKIKCDIVHYCPPSWP